VLVRYSPTTAAATAYFAFRLLEAPDAVALEGALSLLSRPPVAADAVLDMRLVGGVRLVGIALSADVGEWSRSALQEASATLAAALQGAGVAAEPIDVLDAHVFHPLAAPYGGTHG
jgi:hypothetical protein